jgi:hypothetical protein
MIPARCRARRQMNSFIEKCWDGRTSADFRWS